MAKKTQEQEAAEQELLEIQNKIKEEKQKYIATQTAIEENAETIRTLQDSKAGLEAEIEELVEKRNALDVQIDERQAKLETSTTSAPAKGAEVVPGIYLKDNQVYIPGYGHRKKSAGPLKEEEFQAFMKSFEGSDLTAKQIKAKFLIEVTEDED